MAWRMGLDADGMVLMMRRSQKEGGKDRGGRGRGEVMVRKGEELMKRTKRQSRDEGQTTRRDEAPASLSSLCRASGCQLLVRIRFPHRASSRRPFLVVVARRPPRRCSLEQQGTE